MSGTANHLLPQVLTMRLRSHPSKPKQLRRNGRGKNQNSASASDSSFALVEGANLQRVKIPRRNRRLLVRRRRMTRSHHGSPNRLIEQNLGFFMAILSRRTPLSELFAPVSEITHSSHQIFPSSSVSKYTPALSSRKSWLKS